MKEKIHGLVETVQRTAAYARTTGFFYFFILFIFLHLRIHQNLRAKTSLAHTAVREIKLTETHVPATGVCSYLDCQTHSNLRAKTSLADTVVREIKLTEAHVPATGVCAYLDRPTHQNLRAKTWLAGTAVRQKIHGPVENLKLTDRGTRLSYRSSCLSVRRLRRLRLIHT